MIPGTRAILQFIAALVVHAHRPPDVKPNETPYRGLLSEFPPVDPALFEPDPPLWFARLAMHMKIDDIGVEWAEFQSWQRERMREHVAESIRLLFEHYGIDRTAPDAGMDLAMALAGQHVPALQVERAARLRQERRAKKPSRLDVPKTAYLFLTGYLDEVRKKRPLSSTEEHYAERWAKEIKDLPKRTVRDYRNQMQGATLAYWKGCETDFQRQFVEQVEPLLVKLFDELRANKCDT